MLGFMIMHHCGGASGLLALCQRAGFSCLIAWHRVAMRYLVATTLTRNNVILISVAIRLINGVDNIVRRNKNGRLVDGVNHRLNDADIHILSDVIVALVTNLSKIMRVSNESLPIL